MMVHHGEKSKSSSLEQFLPFKFFFSCLTVAIQALFWDFMLEPNSISDHMSVMLMPDIAGMHLQAFTRCPCFFILKTIFHNQQKQSPALELGLSVFPLFPCFVCCWLPGSLILDGLSRDGKGSFPFSQY